MELADVFSVILRVCSAVNASKLQAAWQQLDWIILLLVCP